MIRACIDCGNEVGNDITTGKFWCPKCKEVKETYIFKMKIAILGKFTGMYDRGHNSFIRRLGIEWRKMGHEVIEIKLDELYDFVHPYDVEDCFKRKKKIPLQFIDYYHSPDFIMVEQTYNRYDISNIRCPVIYQHREYTHFPDIDNPDILFGSYPNRLGIFEIYNPYGFHKTKYRDYNMVAVDPEIFPPVEEKIIEGVSYMGWSSNPENFRNANGIVARMVIDDQIEFMVKCRESGYVNYIKGEKGFKHYRDMLGKCEAIIVDGGYINCFGRTMLEAMAKKTMCVIRIIHSGQEEMYRDMGLTDEMCYFIREVEEIADCKYDKEKVEKAYEWVINNHTYAIRAEEVLMKFAEFRLGKQKIPYAMGFARRVSLSPDDKGQIVMEKEEWRSL